MEMFTPEVHHLRELYIEILKRTLSGERQIASNGLPAMIDKATNPDLAEAFRNYLVETTQHIVRLERILNSDAGDADDFRCKVTSSLISSIDSELISAANKSITDVILIAAGNQIEHHQIAVYGTLRTWAEILGESRDAALLDKTLAEEETADQILTQLSQRISVAVPVA